MVRPLAFAVLASLPLLAATDLAEAPPAVDFVRDVQPIFRQHCYGCHGPTQQMNGFRLDRRRDAMRGGTVAVIGPGNSDGSRLYLKLIGDRFGPQMPPTGALPAEQIAILKTWIDEGASWPDDASGETAPAPPDAHAERMIEALRAGDLPTVRAMAASNAGAASLRGQGGSTPLMFAVLYSDAATVRSLLEAGADPNVRNDVGATALMWAVDDPDKVRALVEHGADVNARSDDSRTPLLIASGIRSATPTVKLLLEHGATVNVKAPFIVGHTTPLAEAAFAGNADAFRLLLDAGADPKGSGPLGLGFAFRSGCTPCAEALLKAFDPPLLTGTMLMSSPPLGPALGTPMFLERGAIARASDAEGRTMLMLASASEAMPVDAVKALIARGLDVNARSPRGDTPLDLAARHGKTPVVEALLAAGAHADAVPPAPAASPASSVRMAVERSIPLLQRSDRMFLQKSGCVSCHNNNLTAMTAAAARQAGIRVDETIAAEQKARIGAYLDSWRERALQGVAIPGAADTISYIMLGLAAEQYTPDAGTEAQVRLLRRLQSADGRWQVLANRPPIESSDIEVTAASMRALQLFAPARDRSASDRSVQAAAAWLAAATPRTTEDRVFQLLGLSWSRGDADLVSKLSRALVAEQRPDGGWAQLPTMTSDAYATGQALTALLQTGTPARDVAVKRGVEFLLKTQLADGSWYVRTRAIPIQPLFDAGFPHGRDAFISAAATNWATAALVAAR